MVGLTYTPSLSSVILCDTRLPMTGGGGDEPFDKIDRLTRLKYYGTSYLADHQYRPCPHLEYPGFLCTVEGLWVPSLSESVAVYSSNFNGAGPVGPSLGMRRAIKIKFKIPHRKVPIHPEDMRSRLLLPENDSSRNLRGRKRPLQPGGGGVQGYVLLLPLRSDSILLHLTTITTATFDPTSAGLESSPHRWCLRRRWRRTTSIPGVRRRDKKRRQGGGATMNTMVIGSDYVEYKSRLGGSVGGG